MKKGLFLTLVLGSLLLVTSSFAGTDTLPFRMRVGKVYVSGEKDILNSVQCRFYTQIFHPNLGVAVGLASGSENKIYLLNVSYQLVPDVFDFVSGVAAVEKVDEVDLKFSFGCNFDGEVFKKILSRMLDIFS